MSAKEHDHDHDHHDHDHHDHDDAQPSGSAARHARARLLEVAARARGHGRLAAVAAAPRSSRPARDQAPELDPMSRRNFFHLMGASAGLAGLAVGAGACRYEKEEIVPLARRPEDQIPGTTLQYATTLRPRRRRAPDGRDLVRGSSDPPRRQPRSPVEQRRHRRRHEAPRRPARRSRRRAILHLYDPDRSQGPLRGPGRQAQGASLDAFKAALAELRKQIDRRRRSRALARRRRRRRSPALRARARRQGRLARVRADLVGQRARRHASWRSAAPCVRSRASTRPRRSSRSTATCSSSIRPRLATAATSRAAAARAARSASSKMNRLWVDREHVLEHRRDRRSPPAAAQRATACRSRCALDAVALAAARAPNSEFLKETKVAEVPHGARRRAQAERGQGGRHRRPPSAAGGPRDRRAGSTRRSAPSARRSTTSRCPTPIARRTSTSITALAKDMAAGKVAGADHPRRQPGLRRAGGSRLRRRARQGRHVDPPLAVRRRDLAEDDVARAAARTSSRRGAMPAPGTARSRSRSR